MTATTNEIKALKNARPEYKWKVQTAKEYGCTLVAYVDARIVADILDDTVGPENWQCKYEEVKGVVYCSIGILTDSGWVWKQDAGSESNMDAEKGQASDAFKRAAVRWGICRFLYNLDAIKIKEVTKNRGGKWVPAQNGKQIWDLTKHVRQMGLDRGQKEAAKPRKEPATADQKKAIQELAELLKISGEQLQEEIKRDYSEKWATLSFDSADLLIERLNIRIADQMDQEAATAK